MPTATAWRRRYETTARRASSPERPRADSIERLSPEPVPTTPVRSNTNTNTNSRTHHSSSRKKKDPNALALQGLGLSHTSLQDKSVADPDHLYLDAEGRAHLGAKLRSPKHTRDPDHAAHSARRANAKSSTAIYRGPPKRGHARTTSTIDDLANIAIATSPNFTTSHPAFHFAGSPVSHQTSRPNTSYINGYSQDSFDRPAKRIKSERLYQMEWSEPEERPRSSYTYQSEVRKEDAELLLSLQNGFSFKSILHPASSIPKPEPEQSIEQSLRLEAPHESKPDEIEEETMVNGVQHSPKSSGHGTEPDEPSAPYPLEAVNHEMPEDTDHQMTDVKKLDHFQSEEDEEQDMQGVSEPDNEDREIEKPPPIQAATGTAEREVEDGTDNKDAPRLEPEPEPQVDRLHDLTKKSRRVAIQTQPVCPTCNQMQYNGREGEATIDWIKCEGSCNRWFHIPCAGFSDQEVKKVAKFICKDCEPQHGPTTYARTSTRARAAPDYAALNEGVMKSSEDSTMHHYVPKFKDGSITYLRDDFARIRPEVLTSDFWENMDGMKRPFVVPACWNPRWGYEPSQSVASEEEERMSEEANEWVTITSDGDTLHKSTEHTAPPSTLQTDTEEVLDLDQDYLDMVMPKGLTVRRVAELYGPDEPVPVIEVKTQEQKGKFTLRQWANYYEETGSKPIRNVISLEVSHSRLGRLIRRPKVVRDIDLEAQVWDPQSRADGKKRPIAFYCLMSVGDSYTDFHIDFGGSSVYYHILQGMKTFFFIPPTDKYLKKYEEWNNSPEQNDTWLPDLCDGNVTRVDLRPGDTAFIPAGWIHSVWTPEDSLVIGGNFLTRYDLDGQIKVTQIEKATNVSAKFRYPFFQMVMWYTLIKYLEDDPVPESVIHDFQDDPDYRYLRAKPVWADRYIEYTADNEPDEGDYNARNYSRSEIKGLLALRDYLYRTARIHADLPVDNINKKQIDAVKASVPKNHGDPLQLICLFAVWVAWKTGNVTVPDWVHSDSVLQQEFDKRDKEKAKKPEVFRIPPERASTRRKNQASPAPLTSERQESPETRDSKSPSDASNLPYPRIACTNCRKKRQKCQHPPGSRIEESAKETLEKDRRYSNVTIDIAKLARASPVVASVEASAPQPQTAQTAQPAPPLQAPVPVPVTASTPAVEESISNTVEVSPSMDLAQAALARLSSQPPEPNGVVINGATAAPGSAKKGRSKACDECRKSKRRCVHDEHGRVDPAKAAEPSKPRGSNSGKRPARISDEHQAKRVKSENSMDHYPVFAQQPDVEAMIDPALMGPVDPMLGLQYPDPCMPTPEVNTFITSPPHLSAQDGFTMQTGPVQPAIDPNLDPALMNSDAIDPSLDQISSLNHQRQELLPSALPQLTTAVAGTPDMDKSYSPITTAESAGVNSKHESDEDQPRPAQSTVDKVVLDEEVSGPQTNGVAHSTPLPVSPVKPEPEVEQRRPSSAATGISPNPEATSPLSHRSSSHTSDTLHQAAAIQPSIDASSTNQTVKHEMGSMAKQEVQAAPLGNDFVGAERAASSTSEPEDPSERLARELQAQEHGLRRRPSVRIS